MTSQQKISKNTLFLVLITSVIAFSKCCPEQESPCKNGECLNAFLFCDGTPNCSDGSDETAEYCIPLLCPPFTFRCTYGACVRLDARCNGTSECADKSDENVVMCGYEETKRNTICGKDDFECDSGQCVDKGNACDGQADCSDRSDETVKNCASIFCPISEDYFRCGYGACISVVKKCDGKPDCLDGSDEAFLLCGVRPTFDLSILTEKTPVVSLVTPIPIGTIQKSTCTVPNVKYSRLAYESDPKIVLRPGDEVPTWISITYECMPGYNLEGPNFNLCNNGSWFSSIHPICTRYCPPGVLKGVTFHARCIRDGTTVPCNDRIKPGTVAKISCPNKYRVPAHNPTQILLCEEDGGWDYPPSRCEPICGEELLPSVPFLVGGQLTNITAVPWHVGVYIKNFNEYKHHCGGTIISAKVVISAAHCFWDNANQNAYDNSLYTIAAGKYNRDYYMDELGKAQFQNVSQIAIPPDYNGQDANFKADLAVVVLTNALIFSEFVAPACIQWQKDGAKSAINGLYGQVAGWGRDESGGFSDELRTILIPGSSYDVCRNQVEPRYADSITDDKFCVLNNFNTNACQGDSGGGFAVKKVVGGKSRYFLWGVVSTGVPKEQKCSHYKFVSYTNIQYYEGFITDFETRNRPK